MQLMLKVINGGQFDEHEQNHLAALPWLNGFYAEMCVVRKGICEKHPEVVAYSKNALAKKGRSLHNLSGTVLTYVLSNIENRIIEAVLAYLQKEKHIVHSLCWDGM